MKYAREVIELLAAYPGREFKMSHIVRHISKGRVLPPSERNAIRIGVFRVLKDLGETGQVFQNKTSGTRALYSWAVPQLLHEVRANCYANCNNIGGGVAS